MLKPSEMSNSQIVFTLSLIETQLEQLQKQKKEILQEIKSRHDSLKDKFQDIRGEQE